MRVWKFNLIVLALLAGCRHPIEIIGQGDVMSASGDRNCLLEEYAGRQQNCTLNNVTSAYKETYFAVPREGWQFGAWGNYCAKNDPADQCTFDITADLIDDSEIDEAPPLVAYFRSKVTEGHKALLMGHSFFDPFSRVLLNRAKWAGFDDHVQDSFYSGGGGGAPIAFWNDTGSDNNVGIKKVLDAGGITLLGMTYYPNPDRELNLQGYKNWIDYALQDNDDFAVFIGAPWNTDPASVDWREYKRYWLESIEDAEIHYFIDQLRTTYPDLEFYCIPYGMGAIELKKLFETGKLPDVIQLVGDNGSSVFADELGHPASILITLGDLIWLKAIYGVDLSELDYSDGYTVDLREIATRVVNNHNHRYSAP